jgi:hypothetical protein
MSLMLMRKIPWADENDYAEDDKNDGSGLFCEENDSVLYVGTVILG